MSDPVDSPRRFPAARPGASDTRRDIYTVSRLAAEARQLVEGAFPEIWVEGEISNLSRPASGHLYFSLKDQSTQVRCALFRGRQQALSYSPREGAHVIVRAKVSFYEPRSDFQLLVQHIEDAGEGALRRAFEELKNKLNREGLFDPAHKRELPLFPGCVGLITSPTGAAIRDLVITFRRRCPAIRLVLYPVSVQGNNAAPEIVSAIRTAQHRAECDVLIVGRGGGSLEDLMAFNDERVARAVHACTIPVVSGVGHEIDVTICDLVADQRAATPTAAAELVSPDRREWLSRLAHLQQALLASMSRRLSTWNQRADELSRRLVHPRQRLLQGASQLRALRKHLIHLVHARLYAPRLEMTSLRGRFLQHSPAASLRGYRIASAALGRRVAQLPAERLRYLRRDVVETGARLNSVSPLATLARGYAMVNDSTTGKLVTTTDQVKVGSAVDVRLAAGELQCTVDAVYPAPGKTGRAKPDRN